MPHFPRHAFRRAPRAVALLLTCATLACSTPAEPSASAGLRAVHATGGVIMVGNRTAAPMYVIAFGRQTAALVNWGPCVDAALCPPIQPGETRQVTVNTTAPDGSTEHEAIVYWWHAVPGDDGEPTHDEIRSAIVRL